VTEIGWILVVMGGLGIVVGIVSMFFGDNCLALWPIVAMGCALIVLIAGGVLLMGAEHADCKAKGGHEVVAGPPTYVMAGKVMVPIENTRCEVPQ